MCGDSSGHLLVPPCLVVVTKSGQVQQLYPEKGCLTHWDFGFGSHYQVSHWEMWSDGWGQRGFRVDEGNHKYQLQPWDQLQQWELYFITLTSLNLSFFSGREVHGILTKYVRRTESTWHKGWTIAAVEVLHLGSHQESTFCSAAKSSVILQLLLWHLRVSLLYSSWDHTLSRQPQANDLALGLAISAQHDSLLTSNLCPGSPCWTGWDIVRTDHGLRFSLSNPAFSLFIFHRC